MKHALTNRTVGGLRAARQLAGDWQTTGERAAMRSSLNLASDRSAICCDQADGGVAWHKRTSAPSQPSGG